MKKSVKITLGLVVIGLLIFLVLYKKEISNMTGATSDVAVINEQESISTENNLTQGRVDIFVQKRKENILEVQFNNTLKEAEKNMDDKELYTIQSSEKTISFTVTSLKTSQVTLNLRAPLTTNKASETKVKFTSLKVDGKEFLNLPQEVDYTTPYDYTFISGRNKSHTIEVIWE